jgi:hypothetical protein
MMKMHHVLLILVIVMIVVQDVAMKSIVCFERRVDVDSSMHDLSLLREEDAMNKYHSLSIDTKVAVDISRIIYHLATNIFDTSPVLPMFTRTRIITNAHGVPCPDAYLAGYDMFICSNMSNLIAHEWAHALMFHYGEMFGDIEQFESRILMESYSDIISAVVRIAFNKCGLLEQCPASEYMIRSDAFSCDDKSTRWKLGVYDEIAKKAKSGMLRDMWNPECPAHQSGPAYVSSQLYVCPDNYRCNVAQHRNTGVNNRAFALLVDGSKSLHIESIGIHKATAIFWRTMTLYLNRSTLLKHNAENLM